MIKTAFTATLALTTTLVSFALTLVPFESAHAREDMVVNAAPQSERVPYQISELATERGVRDLTSRVRKAAHHVCEPRARTFAGSYSEVACFHPTFKDGLAQIDRAVARARSGAMADAGQVTVGLASTGR